MTPAQILLFQQRSSAGVTAAFNRLDSYWINNQWLNSTNRYAINCVANLTIDFTGGNTVNHNDLSEYVAASTITHCMDGWSYLGKAIHALMSGDHDCSRHLGYYAEMRAAMSLLAADGVGVFSSEHVIVDHLQQCTKLGFARKPSRPNYPNGPGTHLFVWDALQEWADAPASSTLILETVNGGGDTLSAWTRHVGAIPATFGQLAKEWLLRWGLDIKQFADDHHARNYSSYRPTAFASSRPATAKTVTDFVSHLWELTQPLGANSFIALDRRLVKTAIHTLFEAQHGNTPANDVAGFQMYVNALLSSLQPQRASSFAWNSYLTDLSSTPIDLLQIAAGTAAPTDPLHALQVLARAFLLLRIATGACHKLISGLPPTSRAHLTFWADLIGEDRGLWEATSKPEETNDLWQDASDAIQNIAERGASLNSFNSILSNFSSELGLFASCERIGLWGFGL